MVCGLCVGPGELLVCEGREVPVSVPLVCGGLRVGPGDVPACETRVASGLP